MFCLPVFVLFFLSDVDECGQSRDIPLCGVEATCLNEVGSYRCICPVGMDYDSDTRTCQSPSQGGQQEFGKLRPGGDI